MANPAPTQTGPQKQMKTPKIDIVVTRHPALVAYLRDLNIITADTPVIEHATADDVRGRHVLGILPHHLSAIAATITEIPMRTTVADREAMQRGDLTIERLREVAGDPCTYTVEARWSPAKFWPVRTEPHPNGRDAWAIGGDRSADGDYYIHPLSLKYDVKFHTDDLAHYRDGGSYIIQGTTRVDAAAWAAGRVELAPFDRTQVEQTAYEDRCRHANIVPLSGWREAIDIPVAVVMAVEWHDLVHCFSEGTSFGFGKPVAIMQHEPLMLFTNGQRARVRLKFYNGEADPRALGIDIAIVPPDSDDGMRAFETDKETRRGRCRNEADLIVIAESGLRRRAA